MISQSLRWRLSLSYAGIALITVLLLGFILIFILFNYYLGEEADYLSQNAEAIRTLVEHARNTEMSDEALQQLLEVAAFTTNTQISILGTNKDVLMESSSPLERTSIVFGAYGDEEMPIPDLGASFAIFGVEEYTLENGSVNLVPGSIFPEGQIMIETSSAAPLPGNWITIPGAGARVSGPTKITVERSSLVDQRSIFNQNDEFLGYVELSNGPAYGREIVRSVAWGWAIAAAAAVLLAAAAGMWVSRRLSAPIESLTQTTAQMAAGDLSARAGIEREDEFGLLAKSFNLMADSIEAKVDALRRFVADAAHQLHTPLTALRINLEMIDDQHASRALERVEQMDDLTRSLLNLSQLAAIESEIQFDEVDLVELLQEITEPYASRAEQADLSFDQEILSETAIIKGDAAQLANLIQNLLDNAIKFTPPGGQVHVKLNALDDGVELTVADTGIGIPKDDIPHLFSRFHRGRNASTYPGSGLGLAIVKAIADQHGARIFVESDPNGTVFVAQFSRQE